MPHRKVFCWDAEAWEHAPGRGTSEKGGEKGSEKPTCFALIAEPCGGKKRYYWYFGEIEALSHIRCLAKCVRKLETQSSCDETP